MRHQNSASPPAAKQELFTLWVPKQELGNRMKPIKKGT